MKRRKKNELHKKMVAVKSDSINISLDEIYGIGAKWAMNFTFNTIKKTTENL